jgi:hypothetical protein
MAWHAMVAELSIFCVCRVFRHYSWYVLRLAFFKKKFHFECVHAQGAKLEIESVLRETCDRVLSADPPAQGQGQGQDQGQGQGQGYHAGRPTVSKEKLHMRAVALQIMGEVG